MLNRFVLLGWCFLTPLWATLVLAGCAASPGGGAPPPAPVMARLAVVNLTSHSWLISLASARGGEPRVLRVEPRATVELELRGGDYVIEQTLLVSSGQNAVTRQLPASFEGGESYQWPLATLGSEPTEPEPASGGGGR